MPTTDPTPPDLAQRTEQRGYAWLVFALTFALMLSDFMTRSVINAVLPLLKREWTLSDGQLGALVSAVPLMVGLASWPVSLLADRGGHVRSVTAMAALWCLATIGCGLSQNHTQMLMARGLVGLGEAGYGSVGGAILSSVFPAGRMAAILGAFQAAAVLGTVLGVALGGVIAAVHGWQAAFVLLGAASLIVVVLYPWLVREPSAALRVRHRAEPGARVLTVAGSMREVFAKRSAVLTYVACGLQMFVVGVLGAWIPSYFARAYGLPADEAAMRGALVILMAGIGMVLGGVLADRTGKARPDHRLRTAAAYALVSFSLLTAAFTLPPGSTQMVLLLGGSLAVAAHSGVTAAVIVDLSHPALRATALATVVLFNNLLGLAPGPYFVGLLSDATSLKTALAVMPVVGLLAAACFLLAARRYASERAGAGMEQGLTATAAARPD